MKSILVVLLFTCCCIVNVVSSPVQKPESDSQNESKEIEFVNGEEQDEYQAKLIETTTFDYFQGKLFPPIFFYSDGKHFQILTKRIS